MFLVENEIETDVGFARHPILYRKKFFLERRVLANSGDAFFRLRLESLRRSCGVDDVEVIRRVRNGKEWEIVVVRDDQVNESENTRAFVTMLPMMMISAVLFALSEEQKNVLHLCAKV